MKLKNLYQIKSRFHRSVQIELDSVLDDYIVTQSGLKILWRIANAVENKFATKAWSITGPYGSGKSAFIIFLKTLFGGTSRKETREARELLKKADKELYKRLFGSRNVITKHSKGFCPALVSAGRERIEYAIVKGLLNGLRSFHEKPYKVSIVNKLEAISKECKKGNVPSSDLLIECCERAVESVRKNKGSGLILVIDELGKCLEAAALNSENDIFVLQKLAEFASRSKENDFLFFTVLHQSFERYAVRLDSEKRSEWAKIQGRFEDISFVDSSDQVYKLISYALEVNQSKHTQKDIVETTSGIFKSLDRFTHNENQLKYFYDILPKCLPLHPLTTMTLVPLFRSKFAQNERSLFAFLTSMEPCSFTDFLNKTEVDDIREHFPLYCLHDLYDYLMTNFGITLFTHSYEKKWVEIDQALSRSSDDLEKKVIKTVGLLNLFGQSLGLSVNAEAIACAIDINKKREILSVVDSLCKKSITVFRRHSSSYVLWGGSDIDIDKRVQECIQTKITNSNIAEMLNKLFPLRPKVAKRHLYKTGTLRYFNMRYVDEVNIQFELEKNIEDADGQVLLVINARTQGTQASLKNIINMLQQAPKKTKDRTIIGYTENPEKMMSVFKELLALQWIRKNTPELQGDQIAVREIDARLLQVERLVDEIINQLFFPTKAESNWNTYWMDGKTDRPRKKIDKKELSSWISNICDSIYRHAPVLKNELINRNRVSATSSSARRTLLHHILDDADKKDLGITGFPAEYAMYQSVLSVSRLHQRLRSGGWGFATNLNTLQGSSWKMLWERLTTYLEEHQDKKVPITDLITIMKEPPFGLKDGVIPVILAALLKAYNTEIALFEQGTFKPTVQTTDFDLLSKVPHKFSVQLCRITGIKAEIFDRLMKTLVDDRERRSDPKKVSLLHIVKMLCTFVSSLPAYTRNTLALSDKAQAVRRCLLEAVEPANLLYRDLPVACGFGPISHKIVSSEIDAKAFVTVLKNTLIELQRKETELFGKIENILLHTFSLQDSKGDYREQLRERADRVISVTLDPVIKSFLVRVVDNLEHRAWLDSVGTVVIGNPPLEWSDNDLLRFEHEMASFKAKIEKYEKLVLEKGIKSVGIKDEVIHISIISDKKPEKFKVIHLPLDKKHRIIQIEGIINETVHNLKNTDDIDLVIGAMSRTIAELIDEHKKVGRGPRE